jgi:hypothetical protein
MPEPAFRASRPYEASHPDAMAVYCSDGRFTDAVEELLRGLGHDRLDTMTLPGGPALFNPWLAGMSESITVTAAARFLIEAHSIRRVILVAHEGCGYYRKHCPGLKPVEVRRHQEEDLRRAASALKAMPVVTFLYVAMIDGGHVQFERLG